MITLIGMDCEAGLGSLHGYGVLGEVRLPAFSDKCLLFQRSVATRRAYFFASVGLKMALLVFCMASAAFITKRPSPCAGPFLLAFMLRAKF